MPVTGRYGSRCACGSKAHFDVSDRTGTGEIRRSTCPNCKPQPSAGAEKGVASSMRKAVGAWGLMLRRYAEM